MEQTDADGEVEGIQQREVLGKGVVDAAHKEVHHNADQRDALGRAPKVQEALRSGLWRRRVFRTLASSNWSHFKMVC